MATYNTLFRPEAYVRTHAYKPLDLERIEEPADEPVSQALLHVHGRLDIINLEEHLEDPLFGLYISAARERAEAILNRALVTQTWRLYLDEFPSTGHPLVLYRAPIQRVKEMEYGSTLINNDIAFNENFTLIGPAAVIQPNEMQWPCLSTFRKPRAIRIDYVAGYGGPDQVPKSIVLAILMLATHYYENREATAPIDIKHVPETVMSLLRPKVFKKFY